MSDYDESWREVSEVAAEVAVRTAWQQWAAVGSLARSPTPRKVQRVVDPEALVLVSLTFQEHERRFRDLVRWWARVGAPLTSVQRMRTLAAGFGGDAEEHLGAFSRWASESGHRSWTPYAMTADLVADGDGSRSWKGPPEPTLLEPATLMLRMRAAFGVGAKPDVLSFLIGLQGSMATVSAISRAIGYTETAVRDALKDMVLARLVRETSGRPARYRALHRPWVDLLELDVPGENEDGCGPAWGMWPPLFSLLHALHGLGAMVVSGEESEYVVASAARDAVERSRHAFEFHGIDLPDSDRYPGRSFVDALLEITESVSAWTEEHR